MSEKFTHQVINQPYLAYSDCNAQPGARPRIVHMVEAFNNIGGPPVLVRQIIHSPLAELYEFHVISYAIKGVSPKSLFRLRSLVSGLNPDIVHVHGLKPDGFHAVLAAKMSNAKKIITVIHSSTELDVSSYVSLLSKLRRWVVCNILETATLLLSNSVYTVCDHIRNNNRIRAWAGTRLKGTIHNCMHIPAVPAAKKEIREKFGFYENDLLILFVGRICNDKGLPVLADAMDEILASVDPKGIKLVLVGTGSGAEFENIKKRFSRLAQSNNAVFLGAQNDVFSLNKMADIFVLPSVFKENFSFSLLEATASGIPVIATDHGGNPELVLNMQTGMLVPPGDAHALADAIRELICKKDLRAELGKAGQERTQSVFGVEKMLEKTRKLYQEVL